jgi:hypothetical protein
MYTFEVHDETKLKDLKTKQKWLEAPGLCLPNCGVIEIKGVVVYKPGDPIESLNENEEPFTKYWELRRIRNDIVHLKPCFRYLDNCDVSKFINNREVYSLTNIPKDISLIRFSHAEIARDIFTQMVNELNRLFMGQINQLISVPIFGEKIIKIIEPEK